MPTAESEVESKQQRAGRLELRPARFDDYDQLIRLESTLSPQTLPFNDWRALWTGNPLWQQIGSWWPIGWVFETGDGELVGCMGNVALQYHFRGERLLVAAGRAWLVLPGHRAFGSAARLMREHFQQRNVDVTIDTSVSLEGGERGRHLTKHVPAGDWSSIACFITDHRALARRALEKLRVPLAQPLAWPVGMGLRLKDALTPKRVRKRHSSFAIEVTDRFESRFDAFWNELLRQKGEILMAARDCATLSWHFTVALKKRRLWIFTASRNNQIRAYCIFQRKDVGLELPRMRLVDFQTIEPDADLLRDLLAAALQRCVAEDIAVLDRPGVGLPTMRTFDDCAPYRQKQPWPFWYRTNNLALRSELREPAVWEPSEYDGDASIG